MAPHQPAVPAPQAVVGSAVALERLAAAGTADPGAAFPGPPPGYPQQKSAKQHQVAAAAVFAEATAEEQRGSDNSAAGSRLQSGGALSEALEGLPQPAVRPEAGKDVGGSEWSAQLASEDGATDAAITVDDMHAASASAPQGPGQAAASPRAAQGPQAAAVPTTAAAPVQAPGECSMALAGPAVADAASPASRKRHRLLEPVGDASERRWQAARPEAPAGHDQGVHSAVSVATAMAVDADMAESCAQAPVGHDQGVHSAVSTATAVAVDADMDEAAAPAHSSMIGKAEVGAAAPAHAARLDAALERPPLALQRQAPSSGAAACGGKLERASGQAAAQPAALSAANPPWMDVPRSARSTAPAQAIAPRIGPVQQPPSPLQPTGALGSPPGLSAALLRHAHPPAVGAGLRAAKDSGSVQQPRELSAACSAAGAGAPAPMQEDGGGSEDSFRSAHGSLARDGSLASTAATEWQDALSSVECATPPATPGRRSSAPFAAPPVMHPGTVSPDASLLRACQSLSP